MGPHLHAVVSSCPRPLIDKQRWAEHVCPVNTPSSVLMAAAPPPLAGVLSDVFNQGRFAEVVQEGEVVSPFESAEERQQSPIGSLVCAYGFTFRLTPSHVRPAELESWRGQGDDLADAAVRLFARARAGDDRCPAARTFNALDYLLSVRDAGANATAAPTSPAPPPGCPFHKRESGRTSDSAVAPSPAVSADDVAVANAFLDAVTTVPEWVDWDRVVRGQRVFIKNCTAFSLALLHISLVGGFGAPRVNSVLNATGEPGKGRVASSVGCWLWPSVSVGRAHLCSEL